MSATQFNDLEQAAKTIARLADETGSEALCWAALDLQTIVRNETICK